MCQEKLSANNQRLGGVEYIKVGWQDLSDWRPPKSPRTCYLLDLTGSTDDIPTQEFGEDLVRDADSERYNGIYLVVLTTPEVWSKCRTVTGVVTRGFTQPAASEILEKRLRLKLAVPAAQRWLDSLGIKELIERIVHPSEAADLADEISRNSNRLNFDEAVAEVIDKFGSWKNYLRRWFDDHKDVPDRAAMLSAAVLDPSSSADILAARKALLGILKEQEPEESPLSGPGRTGYLSLLNAHQIREKVSISHHRKGLDEAVLRFVWNEWPEAQGHLERWLLGLASSAPKSKVSRIARVAVQAAIHAESSAYLGLVRKIVSEYPESRPLALEILELTVLDPKVGAQVRKRLLEWITKGDERIASLAVQACGGQLGQERPSIALYRILRAMSREPRDSASKAAEKALILLAEDEISRFAVLDTVRTWIKREQTVGISAFYALASGSADFVGSTLSSDLGEIHVEFFEVGWGAAAKADSDRKQLARAIGSFIDMCEEKGVSADVVTRIISPILADSFNRSLASMVLRGGQADPPAGDLDIRSRLFEALIHGRLEESKAPRALLRERANDDGS